MKKARKSSVRATSRDGASSVSAPAAPTTAVDDAGHNAGVARVVSEPLRAHVRKQHARAMGRG